jgi:transcription-repair coupling factor (superfamily II helicase)
MSTLHQLRGRVGRSTRQAYAYFMQSRESITIDAQDRLRELDVSLLAFFCIYILFL